MKAYYCLFAFFFSACSGELAEEKVEFEIPSKVLWEEASEDDFAGLDPAKRNLFTFRGVEHDVFAWGERTNITPSVLESSGGQRGFVDQVINGAVKSGSPLAEREDLEDNGRFVARCRFEPPGGDPFIGIFAITEAGFTAITIKGETVFALDSAELDELVAMVDVEL